MTTLTREVVKSASPTGRKYRIADHKIHGLFLRVSAGGVKTYIIMYRDLAGMLRECQIGRADVLSLDDARLQAQRMLGDRAKGVDPLEARAASRRQAQQRLTGTFRMFGEEWEKIQKLKGKAASTNRSESYLLRNLIFPKLGELPLGEIRRSDIMDLMTKVASENGLPTSNKVHTLVVMVLNAARDRELIQANPALGLRKLYKPQPRERVLSSEELAVLWNALTESAHTSPGETTGFHPTTARALQMCLLTGQRREEVAGMSWSEVDMNERFWKMPRERVKNRRSHTLPLSSEAIGLLRSAKRVSGESPWVFPAPVFSRSATIADHMHLPGMALRTAIARFAKDRGWPSVGPHDLRRTMATRMAEEPICGSTDVIASILNHSPQGVTRQVYVRANYLPQARLLVEAWGQQLVDTVGRPTKQSV